MQTLSRPPSPAHCLSCFFGDAFEASIATVGINPSWQEYLSPEGEELSGQLRRFETLNSVKAKTRAELSNEQVDTAIRTMRNYYNPGQPIYGWFADLARAVEGMGFSFGDRSAAHLDLVQEATRPAWSELRKADRKQADNILHRDLQFLRRQFDELQFRIVVCTSALVWQEVSRMLGVRTLRSGRLARLSWNVGRAELSRGLLGIVGWNIPLKRPTGLDREGQRQLERLLIAETKRVGIMP